MIGNLPFAPATGFGIQMKLKNIFTSKTEYFSIGHEETTGKFYLSIPVSNRLIDYEEYYEIPKACFDRYLKKPDSALEFVEQCRNQQMDHLLMIKPGSDRGTAC
ncbi:hypothetical protein [Pseudomonas lini]|nr:hypothetical protein [Pseudomonas lini]